MSGYQAPGYTQVPNQILDHLHEYKDAELRVVLAVVRQTFGWHQRRVRLSLSKLEGLTGMTRPTVVEGITQAVDNGHITRKQEGQHFLYELIIVEDDGTSKEILLVDGTASKEILPVQDEASKETLPVTSKEILPVLVKKFYPPPIKENSKETVKETAAAAPVQDQPDPEPPPTLPQDAAAAVKIFIKNGVRPGKARELVETYPACIPHAAWYGKQADADPTVKNKPGYIVRLVQAGEHPPDPEPEYVPPPRAAPRSPPEPPANLGETLSDYFGGKDGMHAAAERYLKRIGR